MATIVKGKSLPKVTTAAVEFEMVDVEGKISRFRPAKDSTQSPIVSIVLPDGQDGVLYADIFLTGMTNEQALKALPPGTSFVGSFKVGVARPAMKDGVPLLTKEGKPLTDRAAFFSGPLSKIVRPPQVAEMIAGVAPVSL